MLLNNVNLQKRCFQNIKNMILLRCLDNLIHCIINPTWKRIRESRAIVGVECQSVCEFFGILKTSMDTHLLQDGFNSAMVGFLDFKM